MKASRYRELVYIVLWPPDKNIRIRVIFALTYEFYRDRDLVISIFEWATKGPYINLSRFRFVYICECSISLNVKSYAF